MNRHLYYALLNLVLTFNLFAQQGVTYDPPSPVPGDSLRLTFDVTQNWEYNGTIPSSLVLHWGINGKSTQAGVTPWQLPDPDTWPAGSISGIDGAGNSYVRSPMKRVNDLYQVTIYTNEDFNVLNFVFNSGTPTSFGSNWYHDQLPNGGAADWAISFIYSWQPFKPNPNDTIFITIRNCTQGGKLYWTVTSEGVVETPLSIYWPATTSLYSELGVETTLQGPDVNNECHIELGPFLSARQVVEMINFSVHWDDGSRDSISYAITMDFTPQIGDALITFLSPDSNETVTAPINIEVTVTNASYIELWAGGDSLGYSTASSFQTDWNPAADIFGWQYIIGKAENNFGRVSFNSLPIFIQPQIVHQPAPENIKDGATLNGNEVTFALYAPGKSFVALRGNFNTEFPQGEIMNLSGDTLWWITKTLSAGEHQYQYNIDGIKKIADPWSRDVSWKDPGSGQETWDYRYCYTTIAVGTNPFPWTDSTYQRPPLRDLIIYETHVGDFSGDPQSKGTYGDLMEKVGDGYFTDLGITAIELMPINEFEGRTSWGYNPSFHIAPESAYGTLEALKRLVNTCHEHGIAVILDVVFNHAWGSSPLWQLYQIGEVHDDTNDPYFNGFSPWGHKLEHWRKVGGKKFRTWKYVAEALRTWIEDFHIDGFRYDVSHGIGWDHVNKEGMAYYVWYVHQLDATVYNICEDFPSGSTSININTSPDADAGWHADFHWRMKDALVRDQGNMSDLARVISFDGYNDYTGSVNYTVSHDERRIIYELRYYSSSFARKRAKLGATVCLTAMGLPMIFHGQEFAQNSTNKIGESTIIEPLQWDNLTQQGGQDMFRHYRKLIWLRKNRDVLRSPYLETKAQSDNQQYIIYWRVNDNEEVVIAANFNTANKTVNIPVPHSGKWYEFITDDSVETATASIESYTIPGSEARIFCNYRDWPTYITTVEEKAQDNVKPLTFELAQNYPNPFNPQTKIYFSIAKNSSVKLEIYNIIGQKIKTLINKEMKAGSYQLNWDGTTDSGEMVSSGIYFSRLISGSTVKSRKMILSR